MTPSLETYLLIFVVASVSTLKPPKNSLLNPREWGDLITCPNSTVVTGFYLTYDYEDPSNHEDKTILNGIYLACGLPHLSEQQQENEVIWINGVGKNNTPNVAFSEQKFFCGGYTSGFRLRMDTTTKRLQYLNRVDDDEEGIMVNVKMICEDGEELEGHDEKWDYYPVARYLEPSKCSKGMAVCGVQVRTSEVKQVGYLTTTQLTDLKIQCCPVNSNMTFDDVAMTTIPPYESPFTPSPRRINVTIFDNFNQSETILIKSDTCNSLPDKWHHSLTAWEQKSVCIRLWNDPHCTSGPSRCYCDSTYLSLDDTFKMTNNSNWQGNIGALTPCFLETDQDYTRALIFSEKNYQGDLQGSVILQSKECLTFYVGDRWHKKIASLIVTDGCIEYFKGEECSGDRKLVDSGNPRNDLGEEWEKQIKSLRNCL